MRYSEAKEIVEQLRYAGWDKIKGVPFYIKSWDRDGLRYGRRLNFNQLKYSKLKIKEILYYEEVEAAKAFHEMG